MASDSDYTSGYVVADGVRTHYLEAGRDNDETVVLLHGGEFGGAAEVTWGRTIPALASEYHVLAPDAVGFGDTEKRYDFTDQFDFRVRHLRAFCETLCVDSAHFVGNSMGGGDILSALCESEPPLPVEKAVSVSGGGGIPVGFEELLEGFDCSESAMREFLDDLYYEQWWDETHLQRRLELARVPGQWQAIVAGTLDPPFEQDPPTRRETDYESVDRPVLLVAGADDELKPRSWMEDLFERLADGNPDARFELLEDCGHCAQLERPGRFERLLLDFLAD